MPRRTTQTKPGTHKVLKHTAFESQVVSWLMQDGWQVFLPMLDHGHKTDILISDGPNYHRIQIKTLEATGEKHVVQNLWKDSHRNVVVFFARNSNWGYVTPAFKEDERPLNFDGHQRFEQTKNDFLKAFHKLWFLRLLFTLPLLTDHFALGTSSQHPLRAKQQGP